MCRYNQARWALSNGTAHLTDEHWPSAYLRWVETWVPGGRLRRWEALGGGLSAQTSRVQVETAGGELETRVVRRAGRGLPRSVQVEYECLRLAWARGLAVPQPYGADLSGRVFPEAYGVTAYVEGRVELNPADRRAYARQMGEYLARIHDLGEEAAAQGFLERAPTGFEATFGAGRHDPFWQEERLRAVLRPLWPLPAANPAALLHGDYWPGNLLWRDGRLAAVVDWEDAFLGDPLLDAGISRLDLAWILGWEAAEAFWDAYRTARPVDEEWLPYWDLAAALRLARLAGDDLAGWAAFFEPYGRGDITAGTIQREVQQFIERALAAIAAREAQG